jgi:hypothetical protein
MSMFHRLLARGATRYVAVLTVGASAAWAGAGEVFHQHEIVNAPPQNVCTGKGCAVNTESYAYHATQWRRWPGTRKVEPSPGRGRRVEPPVETSETLPAPTQTLPPPSVPSTQGAGARSTRPMTTPNAPTTRPPVTRATPPSTENTVPEPSTTERDNAAPPVDLDDLFPEETTPPTGEPSTAPPVNEIPPPFDAEDSDARRTNGASRTLNALAAGLNGAKAKSKSTASADRWQAAPLRKVRDEQQAPAGPMLNEPNLMSAPGEGPELKATPDEGMSSEDGWHSTSATETHDAVVPTAAWEPADDAAPVADAGGSNPLRSSGGTGVRKANPLRRR